MVTLSNDLAARGLIHQVTDEALFPELDAGGLTAYIGFDPTADSLHVGSLLQICNLKRLQNAGHRPIALAGGGTGMIGDPGGKTSERPLLSVEEIRANTEAIEAQLARFLDFDASAGSTQAILADNAQWLNSMDLMTFLRDIGKHFTVNQMMAKESVKSRLDRPDQGISYTEFSYMLLQATDFAELYERYGCTLQLGGSDQWGNITAGAEFVRKRFGARAYGLTSPLVTKADGTKFGKSEGGNERVWLDPERTSPYALYQFFLSTEDADVGTYLRYFTFLDLEEIEALEVATKEDPKARTAQRALAASMIDLIHGDDERRGAEAASAALFGGSVASLDMKTLGDLVGEVPNSSLARTVLEAKPLVVDLLAETGLAKSKSEARRTVEQGGAFINDAPREGLDATVGVDDLLFDRYVVLRRGKRSYHVLTIS